VNTNTLSQEKLEKLNAPYREQAEKKAATITPPAAETPTATAEPPVVEVKTETPAATVAEPAVKKEEVKPDAKAEITDESAIEFLRSKGIDVSSFDELTKKAAPKQSEDEETAELIEYGVKNKNLKVDDFLNIKKIKDMPDSELVAENFAAKLKAQNKNITPEQIKEKFDKRFADIDDDGNIIYDETEISSVANDIREKANATIDGVKKEYGFVKSINQELPQLQNKIPNKVQIEFKGETHELSLDPKTTERLKSELKDMFIFYKQNSDGKTPFDMKQFVQNAIWNNETIRKDVIEVISKARADKEVSEALSPYKNAHQEPLDSGKSTKQAFNQATELQRIKEQARTQGLR